MRTGPTFLSLLADQAWRAIPECPGRYVLAAGPVNLPPSAIAGSELAEVEVHVVDSALDPVHIVTLPDGGLISYRRGDGQYLHTLNDATGFERKLHQLGIR